MYMYVYICIHVYTHTYLCTYTHIYILGCAAVYLSVYPICVCVCVNVCACLPDVLLWMVWWSVGKQGACGDVTLATDVLSLMQLFIRHSSLVRAMLCSQVFYLQETLCVCVRACLRVPVCVWLNKCAIYIGCSACGQRMCRVGRIAYCETVASAFII